jgi:hypothetical protein
MDMGMRFTIPKYPRGIGTIKGKGLHHTLRGQSKGDGFYIEPRFFTIEKHQQYVKKKYLDRCPNSRE